MRRAVAAVFVWLLLASGAWAACPAVPSDCGSPTVNNLTIGGTTTGGGLLTNAQNYITSNVVLADAHNGKTLAMAGATHQYIAGNACSTYANGDMQFRVVNKANYTGVGSDARGVTVKLSGIAPFIVMPGQTADAICQNGSWSVAKENRWRPPLADALKATKRLDILTASWSGWTGEGYIAGNQVVVTTTTTGSLAVGMGLFGTGVPTDALIIRQGYDTANGLKVFYLDKAIGTAESAGTASAPIALTAGGVTATVADTAYLSSLDKSTVSDMSPSGYNITSKPVWLVDSTTLTWGVESDPGTASVMGTVRNISGYVWYFTDPSDGRNLYDSMSTLDITASGTTAIVTVADTSDLVEGEPVSVTDALPAVFNVAGSAIHIIDGTHFSYTLAAAHTGSAIDQGTATFGPNDGFGPEVGGALKTMAYCLTSIALNSLDVPLYGPSGGSTYTMCRGAANTTDEGEGGSSGDDPDETDPAAVHFSGGQLCTGGHCWIVSGGPGFVIKANGTNIGSIEAHEASARLFLQNLIIDNLDDKSCTNAVFWGQFFHFHNITYRRCDGVVMQAQKHGGYEINRPFFLDPSLYYPATFTGYTDADGLLHVTAVHTGTVQIRSTLYDAAGSITASTKIATQVSGAAGGVGVYTLDTSNISIGGAGEEMASMPLRKSGDPAFAGALVLGSISGTALTTSAPVVGTISAVNRVRGLNIPRNTWVVSGSGTSWTLNADPGSAIGPVFLAIGAGGPTILFQATDIGRFSATASSFVALDDITFSSSPGQSGNTVFGNGNSVIDLSAQPFLNGGDRQKITAITWAGGTATATVASTSRMTTGNIVSIYGVRPFGFNSHAAVITVASPTTFTYAIAVNPDSAGDSAADNCTASNDSCVVDVGGAAVAGRVWNLDAANIISSATAVWGDVTAQQTGFASYAGENYKAENNTWSGNNVFSGKFTASNTPTFNDFAKFNNLYGAAPSSGATVASLNSNFPCNSSNYGFHADVTDALLPAFGQTVVGGGSRRTGVQCSASNTWVVGADGSIPMVPVALANAAGNVAVNAALGPNYTLALAGAWTLSNPTNLLAGSEIRVSITQTGGGNTLAFDAAYKWPGGTPPTITAANNAVDQVICRSYNGTNLLCTYAQDLK